MKMHNLILQIHMTLLIVGFKTVSKMVIYRTGALRSVHMVIQTLYRQTFCVNHVFLFWWDYCPHANG